MAANSRLILLARDFALAPLLRTRLREIGFELCGVVSEAAAAAHMIARQRPALVLIDVEFTAAEGFDQVVESLRRHGAVSIVCNMARARRSGDAIPDGAWLSRVVGALTVSARLADRATVH